MPSDRALRVAVAGLGYWGPNLARNFDAFPGCELAWCCDASDTARERLRPQFPHNRFTPDPDELLVHDTVGAVAFATPKPTHAHATLAGRAAGKHCFGEKRLAQSPADAERAGTVARESGRILMVGHVLECHPGVVKPLWSLEVHDVSVLLRLAGEEPREVEPRGVSYMREALGEITVNDKGFDERADSNGEYITGSGDIWSPRLSNVEPLHSECLDFVDCVREGSEPISGAEFGVRVVRILEELQRSLGASARGVGTAA